MSITKNNISRLLVPLSTLGFMSGIWVLSAIIPVGYYSKIPGNEFVPFDHFIPVLFLLPLYFLVIRAVIRKSDDTAVLSGPDHSGSNELFQILCDQIPVPVEIYDEKGVQILANKSSENLWELSSEITVGKLNVWKDSGRINAGILEYIKKAYTGSSRFTEPYQIHPLDFDGIEKSKWVRSSILPVPGKEGKTKRVIVMHEDLTSIQHTRDELKLSKSQAANSDRLKKSFLRIISHELRTPLNWIMGFAELIPKEESSERIQEYSTIIRNSGTLLLSIIDSIIDIAMIESDEIELQKEEFQLNELLREVEGQVNQYDETQNKNVDIKIREGLENELSYMYTDREKLKKILINLVSNALKFTEDGYVEIGYRTKSPDNLLLYVKDTGIGIPDDQHSFIFDKFRKTDVDEKRMYNGTGLGLSVSKGFVEKLGGNMWFHSKNGTGSTFYVNIPVQMG